MCETKAVVRASTALRQDRHSFLIATVVQVHGSSYQKPGARMLLTEDRWIAGTVSGCIEGGLVRKGAWRLKDDRPTLVTHDATEPDELGWALGCRGVCDVLLERAAADLPTDPIGVMRRALKRQKPAVIVTVFRAQSHAGPAMQRGLVGGRVVLEGRRVCASPGLPDELILPMASRAEQALRGNSTHVSLLEIEDESGNPTTLELLVEVVEPPIRLFVLGGGHDAVPLVDLASALGWEVFVWAPHPRVSIRQRFAHADELLTGSLEEVRALVDDSDRAACVAMNHHFEQDRSCLEMLLASKAPYIGALGPRHRTETLLAGSRHPGPWDPRLQSPVGLPIGAESPAEVALSIVAQIQATFGAPSRLQPSSLYAAESTLSSYPTADDMRASH